MTMSVCLIGLGSNLGERRKTLDEAAARLAEHPQIRVTAVSAWRETAPAGGPTDQPAFLNGAAMLETSLEPEPLLGVLQQVEADLGRRRNEHWGPRTLDLDLLLFDQRRLATPTLEVPHPRMAWRRFVLEPAAEVAGNMLHPSTGWTVRQLLDHLNTTRWYVAITGGAAVGKTAFARQVARQSGAELLADAPAPAVLSHGRPRQALQIELEFLEARIQALAAEMPHERSADRPLVSDFWLGQSAAYARSRLGPDAWNVWRARWEEVRTAGIRPRLTVLLEAPARAATVEQSDRLILDEVTAPGQGPLLRLSAGDLQRAVAEVLAAIEAMR
jgi:2-amino-4-hydroxy-6-hydroxymethyldihydropteridine diphosphokinase